MRIIYMKISLFEDWWSFTNSIILQSAAIKETFPCNLFSGINFWQLILESLGYQCTIYYDAF